MKSEAVTLLKQKPKGCIIINSDHIRENSACHCFGIKDVSHCTTSLLARHLVQALMDTLDP